MEPTTLNRMFLRTVERFPERTALLSKQSGESGRGPGTYQPITYAQLADRVRCLAGALTNLGVEKGDRVAILSENRPEWAIMDLASLGLGAVTVPIFPTLPAAQVEYLLRNSGAKVAAASDQKQLEKILTARQNAPSLASVVVFEPIKDAPEGVLVFEVLLPSGAEMLSPEEFRRRQEAVAPDDLATFIYTSGTTGEPKGTMLTHNNFASNIQGAHELIRIDENDVFLSFLPLSHVFERMAGYYLPLSAGASIAYCEGVRAVAKNIEEVRPTIMASVPRMYESLMERIQDAAAKRGGREKALFDWALQVGKEHGERRSSRRFSNPLLAVKRALADRLVLTKVRDKLGGRFRFLLSGGAPLPVATAEFFMALGITIAEGYGLTETSPVISINHPDRVRLGTVGPPLHGVEVRLAEDGEILTRGPHVMKGYFNMPEATAEAIDAQGWFHTGDIGQMDADGYLSITDRKKNIIVLANGKKVSPSQLESKFKNSPYISEIMLVGDRRNIITALVVPNYLALRDWCQEHGLDPTDRPALAASPEVKKLIRSEIDRLSGDLADFERVRRVALLDHEFTVEAGELTPTLKVRRKAVEQKYAEAITAMYGDEKQVSEG